MPDKPVKRERTGWRDLWINDKHRTWGWNCPAVDVDFLMIEYDNLQPVALIEYKAEGATINLKDKNNLAIANTANRASIPAFLTLYYKSDAPYFQTWSLNFLGRKRLQGFYTSLSARLRNHPDGIILSEEEYVAFLYHLRGRPPFDIKGKAS